MKEREKVRLQKFLSQAGLASRREAETWITAGRVRVNGQKITEQGTRVDPRRDKVTVDGRPVKQASTRVLLFHKPRGLICSRNDPQDRKTVHQHIGRSAVGLHTVGRLDFNTEGVLLLTNDGDLAHKLTRPEFRVPRVYRVRVRGPVDPESLDNLLSGVRSEGDLLRAETVQVDGVTRGHVWITMQLREGRNRHVRRMCEALGMTVARLIRARFAGVETGALKPGEWRDLTPGELKALRAVPQSPKK